MNVADTLLNKELSRTALIQQALSHEQFSLRWKDGERICIAFTDNSYISIVRK